MISGVATDGDARGENSPGFLSIDQASPASKCGPGVKANTYLLTVAPTSPTK